jgi:hypothetical protein
VPTEHPPVGNAPDFALTISVSTDGQTWTDLEGHISATTSRWVAPRSSSGLAALRGDDVDVKVDQVGLS